MKKLTDTQKQSVSQPKQDTLNDSEKISLMNIIRDEWKARDDSLKSIFWKIIYLSLIITFLPNLIETFGVINTPVPKIHEDIFSVAGIICALLGMYFALGESKRIEALDLLYKRIMNMLPDGYQMIDLKTIKHGAFFSTRLNTIFCIVPYAVVVFLAIIKILFYHGIL